MVKQPYFEHLVKRAKAVGFEVGIENRSGLLFVQIIDSELGVIALWPAFNGSVERTARYALECFKALESDHGLP
jgi:hypothetical protein